MSELIAKYERIDFESDSRNLVESLRRMPGVESMIALAERCTFRVELSRPDAAQRLLATLVHAGVTSIRTTRPSLEEVYVHLIGNRGLKV